MLSPDFNVGFETRVPVPLKLELFKTLTWIIVDLQTDLTKIVDMRNFISVGSILLPVLFQNCIRADSLTQTDPSLR